MRELKIMDTIQLQKQKDIDAEKQMSLDAEGKKLAESKRFTFDVVETPIDPLR